MNINSIRWNLKKQGKLAAIQTPHAGGLNVFGTAKPARRVSARRLVRWIEAAGGDSWLYHFTRNPRSGRAARDGVAHGLEIPYVFNTLPSAGDAADKALAGDMLRRWVNFARDGNLNGKEESAGRINPIWPKYRKDEDQHLEFGDQVRVRTGLDRDACDLLDLVAARRQIRKAQKGTLRIFVSFAPLIWAEWKFGMSPF